MTQLHITLGPWHIESPRPEINRLHYIICAGDRSKGTYCRIFAVSQSVSQAEEVYNAFAAAAIPELLQALVECPDPPSLKPMSPGQLEDWEKRYRQWWGMRCSVLAKVTEIPTEMCPAMDVDAVKQALAQALEIADLDQIQHLIQATDFERSRLIEPAQKSRFVTVAEQESVDFAVGMQSGIAIKLRFTPVYFNSQPLLFWESVGEIYHREKVWEWVGLMLPQGRAIALLDFNEWLTEQIAESKKAAQKSKRAQPKDQQ